MNPLDRAAGMLASETLGALNVKPPPRLPP